MQPSFVYREDYLYCENVNLKEFAEQHETPFYLYSRQQIEANCNAVLQTGQGLPFMACYALKANYNPHLLAIIRDCGFGADVVSGGELQFALRLGFAPQKIVFAGVGKTPAEIELAVNSGIHSLNVESAAELQIIAGIAEKLRKPVRIALRVNPDVEAQTHKYISTGRYINKFGIDIAQARPLFKKAAAHKWLEPEGIHVHIGSQITTREPFLETIDVLLKLSEELKQSGVPIKYLDLGGGIGIDYQNNFRTQKPATDYFNDILKPYLQGFKETGLKLVVELGRSVIANAGMLVSRVLLRKETPLKKFIVVDAAMNNLIRPSLYSAHHEIIPLHLQNRKKETVDVVGPVCESSDFLAKDRTLEQLQQGEFLAVSAAGAYGQVLSSNYNLRPTIKEYLVNSDHVTTIFKGRSIDNLFNEFGFEDGTNQG